MRVSGEWTHFKGKFIRIIKQDKVKNKIKEQTEVSRDH